MDVTMWDIPVRERESVGRGGGGFAGLPPSPKHTNNLSFPFADNMDIPANILTNFLMKSEKKIDSRGSFLPYIGMNLADTII